MTALKFAIVVNILMCATSGYRSANIAQELPHYCLDSCSLACSMEDVCPPGMFCKNGSCRCGVYPSKFLSCNGTGSSVLRYNCVTFDQSKNLTVVGSCLHSMKRTYFRHNFSGDTLYHQLPNSVYGLDDLMCGSLNRTGLQCGSCQPDHYPLAYSFNMACVPCPDTRRNWFKYVMAAYFPLTVFCVIILFFKVNITSSHLFAVVYYCQTLSTPMILRSMYFQFHEDTSTSYQLIANLSPSMGYGTWTFSSHFTLISV